MKLIWNQEWSAFSLRGEWEWDIERKNKRENKTMLHQGNWEFFGIFFKKKKTTLNLQI